MSAVLIMGNDVRITANSFKTNSKNGNPAMSFTLQVDVVDCIKH